jgi:hypothetical protein
LPCVPQWLGRCRVRLGRLVLEILGLYSVLRILYLVDVDFHLLKKFGKPGTAQDIYALGKLPALQISCKLPFLPMIGKRGQKDTSKPVAHIKVSTSITSPVLIPMPFGNILTILSETTRTFFSDNDSKYPTAGVSLRHPTGNVGIRVFIRCSFPFRASLIYSVRASLVYAAISLSFMSYRSQVSESTGKQWDRMDLQLGIWS